MAAIHKYPLPVIDRPIVNLPRNAEILHIGEQYGELFVWALVDPQAEATVEHEYRVIGTGHLFDDEGLKHLVTVVMSHGLVWHIFEEVS